MAVNEKLDNYLNAVVEYGHTLSPTIFITVKKFYSLNFCGRYKYLCETLHPYIKRFMIPFFMVVVPDFLCCAIYKLSWDTTYNMNHLTCNPPIFTLSPKSIVR